MNITTSKRDLARLTSRMNAIAERKSTMPALSNVLLRGDVGLLVATSTDLYQSLIGSIACETDKAGSVAVSAHDLVERVKVLPDGPVVMTANGNSLVLKSKGSARKFTLRAMPGDDFPPVATAKQESPRLSIEVDVLSSLIARTHFAISTDETRAHLNSALIEWDGDTVKMVSTDGHRLALASRKVEGHHPPSTMLVPLKGIQELRRICDEAYGAPRAAGETVPSLVIIQDGPSAFFVHGSTTFGLKLVDAQFPPYAQVIPKTTAHTIRAPRVALADALKAVSVAASERTGSVKLALSKGMMRLSSESADSGDGSDEVACEYAGPNHAIGFKASYLLDVLGAITCDEVDIGVSAELDPITLRTVDNDSADAIWVVMPMRI